MKKLFLIGAVALACMAQAKTITLDVAHPLYPETVEYDANGVWTGTYNEDDFYTIDYEGISFAHEAWADWDYWYGFTISKSETKTFTETSDQFNVVAGGGLAGEGTPFIVAYAADMMGPSSPCVAYFDEAYVPQEVSICQSAWALDNILNGGGVASAFAEGDYFKLTIEGLDENYDVISGGNQVEYFLADFTSADPTEWTYNNGWESVDLTALGEVYGLVFTLTSTDVSGAYSNTALYFGLDGLVIRNGIADFENEVGGIELNTPESNWQGSNAPQDGWNDWWSGAFNFQTYAATTDFYYAGVTVTNETSTEYASWADAYRSASGGAYKGNNFAVWNQNYYGEDKVTFDPQVVKGFFVNNNAYAVHSMCNGDEFAKKFEEEDWFKLTITGFLDGAETGHVDFMLAENGKYVNQWTYVDLSSLGEIEMIKFSMSSTDAAEYGGIVYMNTPAYFAMDEFGAAEPAGYVAPEMALFPDAPAAIDNTENAVSAEKVIRNGQLFILRNGVMYNINGAVVR
ncbi:MAG: DUF4465 domain-containing protein [Paludibacteraceae bacterium]|nr:DUF4465 domain-containing protein [Paludibacteraceae bacterium]